MQILLVVIITLVMFGILIFVHEFGHFITARMFGVKVNEFAIGMGPVLYSKVSEKSGTKYSLKLLPIGGYNLLEGEDDESNDTNAFCSKPVWQRMIIICAGGFMNVLLGIIAMLIIVLSTRYFASNVIHVFVGETENEYIQEYQGLKSGDEILEVNGKKIAIADQVAYKIFSEGDKPFSFKVLRDGQEIIIDNVVFPTGEQGSIVYGIRNFYFKAEEKTFKGVIKQTFYGCTGAVTQIYDSLKGLITGKYGFEALSGPVGIGNAIDQAIETADTSLDGFLTIMNFLVLIAINLGLFNLLPIPALDGGRLVFLIIEGVFRKPIPRKIEAAIHGTFMYILLGLMVVVFFKDIFTVFK